LVDGGLLSNFPVSVFDAPADRPPRWPTFGIKLSARPEADFGVTNRITGPLSFGKAVLDTVTGFHDRMHVDASHALARTIFIDTDAVRRTQFDLSEADRELLYTNGRKAARTLLDGSAKRARGDGPRDGGAEFRRRPRDARAVGLRAVRRDLPRAPVTPRPRAPDCATDAR